MIGQLFFVAESKPQPAYKMDLLGNLIHCTAAGPKEGLVPYGVEVVSSAVELAFPYPWTITIEAVLERIRLVAQSHPETTEAYPGMKLTRAQYPFVVHVELAESEDLVMQAIEILPNLTGEDATAVREQLEAAGVFEIPATETFSDLIHEAAGEGLCVPPIKYVAAGWMSSMKVYRKALVRSA